ncbi:bile acid:sodium symporter family protein [uncultured Oscillibacter sp.]|uniref:bile acid:sodium symporter family protein n=1 Tax=uncultured Oscillibacter sp. TaxID=876091 RepID=UPI0025E0DD8F|nr:bile acid:sodium symporter family protein [uncultured Oscillibacter sp.]
MEKLDAFLGRHMAPLIVLFVLAGIALPDVFSPINDYTMALFAFMTFANSLGGGFREMKNVVLHPLPVLVIFVLLHVAMPLLTLLAGSLLFPEAPLFTTGLVLEYAIPTGVASLLWVSLAQGNTTMCLSVVLLDTLLAPFVIPLTLRLLVGSVVEMDTMSMMGDLMIMVAIPALIAMTMYHCSKGRVAQTWKPRLAPYAKLTMLLLVMANATGCAPFLRQITPTLARVIAAVFALCLLGFFLGYWAGRAMGVDFPTLVTMSLNTGIRNIAAGSVLAIAYFPGDVLFPVAFSPLFLQATTAVIVKVLHATAPGRAWRAAQASSGETGVTVSR